MICRLFDAKPYPESILTYCQLNLGEENAIKFNQNKRVFLQENTIKMSFENVDHFVQASPC